MKEFTPLGSKFFSFRVDPFQEGFYVLESKQEVTSYLPCEKWRLNLQVYPFIIK